MAIERGAEQEQELKPERTPWDDPPSHGPDEAQFLADIAELRRRKLTWESSGWHYAMTQSRPGRGLNIATGYAISYGWKHTDPEGKRFAVLIKHCTDACCRADGVETHAQILERKRNDPDFIAFCRAMRGQPTPR